MSAKTNADVIIGGKVYTLSGYESEAYLQKVASYLNNKMGELEELPDYRRLTGDMKAILLELNIADDFFKAKNQAEKLEEDLQARNGEVYDLKHELVTIQIKLEAMEQRLAELEAENKELLLDKTRLESSILDAMPQK